MGKIKYVFLTIVIILLIFGSFGLINSLNKTKDNDKKEITASSFYVGGINRLGQNVESETSFITDKIGVQGLTIKPKSNSNVTYIVYYYDSSMKFVGKTNERSSVFSPTTIRDDIKWCRIQIFVPDGEKAIIWNKSKYVSQLDISVDKKQVTETEQEKIGLYVKNVIVYSTDGTTITFNENGFTESTDTYSYHLTVNNGLEVDYVEFVFNRDIRYVNDIPKSNINSYVTKNILTCVYKVEGSYTKPILSDSTVQIRVYTDCVVDYYGNFLTKDIYFKLKGSN